MTSLRPRPSAVNADVRGRGGGRLQTFASEPSPSTAHGFLLVHTARPPPCTLLRAHAPATPNLNLSHRSHCSQPPTACRGSPSFSCALHPRSRLSFPSQRPRLPSLRRTGPAADSHGGASLTRAHEPPPTATCRPATCPATCPESLRALVGTIRRIHREAHTKERRELPCRPRSTPTDARRLGDGGGSAAEASCGSVVDSSSAGAEAWGAAPDAAAAS